MSLLRHIGTNSACTHAYIPVYPQSGLPNWPFHGQFKKIWRFLKCAGHEKHIWPFYKIWPVFGPFFGFSLYNEIFIKTKYFVLWLLYFWMDFMSLLQ